MLEFARTTEEKLRLEYIVRLGVSIILLEKKILLRGMFYGGNIL